MFFFGRRMGIQVGDVFFQVSDHFSLPLDRLGEELDQLVLQGVPLALMVRLQQLQLCHLAV